LLMKKLLCLLLLVLFTVYLAKGVEKKHTVNMPYYLGKVRSYQFQNPDSAELYLQKAFYYYDGSEADTLFAELMLLSGIQISIKGNIDSALINFEKSRNIYTHCNHNYGLAESLLYIGEIYYNWANFDKALEYFQLADSIVRQNSFKHLQVRILNYIGKYYHSKGNFSESLSYYNEGLKLAEQYNDTLGIAILHNKIGKHYKTIGDFPRSLEHLLISERLVRKVNNKIELASTYNHLGNIYQDFKDFSNAIRFHKLALKTREEMSYKEGIAKSLKNLGEVLVDINKLDSALVCFEKSYVICNEIGYAKGLIKNIQNEGIILQQQEKYEEAIPKFKKSNEISNRIGYVIGETKALLSLSEVFKRKKDFSRALSYAEKGLRLSERENMKGSIASFYLMQSDIYQDKGEYRRALAFFQKHTKVQNEIVNLESNRKIGELQTQYKLSLQNRENEVLKKDNQIKALMIKRKNLFMLFAVVISGLLVLLVIITYWMFLQKKKANIKLTGLNDNITLKNSELEQLNKKLVLSKDQQIKLFSIISHELRNPLYWFRNLIQMLSDRIDSLDKEMISKSLKSLNESANNTYHLMDNLLHWSRARLGNIKFVPEPVDIDSLIADNIKLVSHYAAYKNLNVQYYIEKGCIIWADKTMVHTVIRNLLSNAIKFTPPNGLIQISCTLHGDDVQVRIKDSGVGMDHKTIERILSTDGTNYIPTTDQETGSGIGLALSKEFIKRNGGELSVVSEPGNGALFYFVIPLFNKIEEIYGEMVKREKCFELMGQKPSATTI
jgi:signal transduction histidine kinase